MLGEEDLQPLAFAALLLHQLRLRATPALTDRPEVRVGDVEILPGRDRPRLDHRLRATRRAPAGTPGRDHAVANVAGIFELRLEHARRRLVAVRRQIDDEALRAATPGRPSPPAASPRRRPSCRTATAPRPGRTRPSCRRPSRCRPPPPSARRRSPGAGSALVLDDVEQLGELGIRADHRPPPARSCCSRPLSVGARISSSAGGASCGSAPSP
jgi:hypothetical protein